MPRLLGWVLILLTLVSTWRIFVKAGHPGWQAIVPVYNVFVTFRIADLPMWQAGALIALVVGRTVVESVLGFSGGGLIVALVFPTASAALWFVACLGIASKFGKGTGFAVGMAVLPFVFYPILAFGSARYGEPESLETLGLSGV